MANYICNKCGASVIVVDEKSIIRPCAEDCKESVRAEIEVTVYSKVLVDA